MNAPQKKAALLTNAVINWFSDEWVIRSYSWTKLDKVPHLADFDLVVFDLLTLPPNSINWKDLFRQNLTPRTFFDVAAHGGEFIAIGDPRIAICSDDPKTRTKTIYPGFLWWTGLSFEWHDTTGDTAEPTPDVGDFLPFVERLKYYKYTLDSVSVNRAVLNSAVSTELSGMDVRARQRILSKNRAGRCIASQIWLQVGERFHESPFSDSLTNRMRQTVNTTEVGPITLLPDIELSSKETLLLLLRDCLSVPIEKIEPEWIHALEAPNQAAIDEEIQGLQESMDSLTIQLERKRQERLECRECLKLLYAEGTDLEMIVRKLLNVLGAEVREPTDPAKEDGWIAVQVDGRTLEGVLEIKSTEKEMFTEKGLRQLLEWQNRGKVNEQKTYKGILICSNSTAAPPDDRCAGFSDSLKNSATVSQVVLLKYEALLAVYQLFTKGKLETQSFWRALFATDGPFDLVGLPDFLCPN